MSPRPCDCHTQSCNDIPLANDDFEFPDLMGAAFDYLIKYFADSAGKKGGEFFTPPEVVQLNVQIMVASLKSDGKHSVVMPHGVLFAHLLKGKQGCSTQGVSTFYCHRDIKEVLRNLWLQKDEKTATKYFNDWNKRVIHSNLERMKTH